MPGVNSKERIVYIAIGVAACAGCIMGIGSLLLYQRLGRDARGRDLVALRRELDDLRRLVDSISDSKLPSSSSNHVTAVLAGAEDITSGLHAQHVGRRPSKESSSQDDEIEFYDAKSEQFQSDYDSAYLPHSTSNNSIASPRGTLELVYSKSDLLLATQDETAPEDRRRAYEMLKKYYNDNRSNYEYLWRLSRATYLYGRTLIGSDEEKRKQLCFEAKDYAFTALALNKDDADVHKWCALTIGTLGDFVGVSQKLKDGWTFKEHIDTALKLRSSDATLRHLSGRWSFGVASLTWWERNLAKAIFSTNVPSATYDEALVDFLEANRLKPNWKENMLFIALCYHNKGEREEARRYLERARDMVPDNVDDLSAENDIEKLWREYYR